MSRSEFRWNKKRKHYAYVFREKRNYLYNLLLHSSPFTKKMDEKKIKEFLKKHIGLFCHPGGKEGTFYIEKRIYVDQLSSFDERVYRWVFHKNDKRKIKRLKKGRRTR